MGRTAFDVEAEAVEKCLAILLDARIEIAQMRDNLMTREEQVAMLDVYEECGR